ncbi:hypothetical protein BJ684DRAFT_18117, partial [Piptocephalis cylindrospora]
LPEKASTPSSFQKEQPFKDPTSAWFVEWWYMRRLKKDIIQPLVVSQKHFRQMIINYVDINDTPQAIGQRLRVFYYVLYGRNHNRSKLGHFSRFIEFRRTFSASTREMLDQMRKWTKHQRIVQIIGRNEDYHLSSHSASLEDQTTQDDPDASSSSSLSSTTSHALSVGLARETVRPNYSHKGLFYQDETYRAFNHTFSLIHKASKQLIQFPRKDDPNSSEKIKAIMSRGELAVIRLLKSFQDLEDQVLNEIKERLTTYCIYHRIRRRRCIYLDDHITALFKEAETPKLVARVSNTVKNRFLALAKKNGSSTKNDDGWLMGWVPKWAKDWTWG